MAIDLLSGRQNGQDWSLGSIIYPESEQKKLFNKIDDLRFDVRRLGANVGGGIYALAGALGAFGVVQIFRTVRGK